MKIRNILFRIKSFNDNILSELETFVFLIVRVFLASFFYRYVIENDLPINWAVHAIIMFYLIYPLYRHYFNWVFYKFVYGDGK